MQMIHIGAQEPRVEQSQQEIEEIHAFALPLPLSPWVCWGHPKPRQGTAVPCTPASSLSPWVCWGTAVFYTLTLAFGGARLEQVERLQDDVAVCIQRGLQARGAFAHKQFGPEGTLNWLL